MLGALQNFPVRAASVQAASERSSPGARALKAFSPEALAWIGSAQSRRYSYSCLAYGLATEVKGIVSRGRLPSWPIPDVGVFGINF
jgi:hypothetical protein